jgi:hypothetical protein
MAQAKTSGSAQKSVGRAVRKARVPVVAGGAALLGVAGGLAVGAARQARRGRRVRKAAKEIGAFGAQMGQLASQLQNTREAANGGKQRSPIEVVLEGLTARRSRA